MRDAGDAIGIFDSGVGGLTVFGRIAARLPKERIVYLGDTARVPYGTKSPDTVIRYARACARILIDRSIKLLVVACNTASAFALDVLREDLDIPVLGVIEPGARRAVRETRNRRIGVIGTAGAISSGQYQQTIRMLAPDAEVYAKACPLFVSLAEEGWTDGPVPAQVAQEYLSGLLTYGIDTLVLGCTHYPLLKRVIGQAAGKAVTLVDSAEAVSEAVAETLSGMDMVNGSDTAPRHTFLVSDSPSGFERIGAQFLGYRIGNVEWVDF